MEKQKKVSKSNVDSLKVFLDEEDAVEPKVIYDLDDDTDDQPATPFGFLVKELDSLDIQKTYNLLKTKITLGRDRLDPDVLSVAVDEAPDWAFKAAQLAIIAKDQLNKFVDITFKLKYAEFADEATRALEQMKKDGEISGQISKEKVENWIILKHKGYKKLLQEKRELEMASEAFKSLASQFESKKSLLQTQGRLSERKQVIIGGGK